MRGKRCAKGKDAARTEAGSRGGWLCRGAAFKGGVKQSLAETAAGSRSGARKRGEFQRRRGLHGVLTAGAAALGIQEEGHGGGRGGFAVGMG